MSQETGLAEVGRPRWSPTTKLVVSVMLVILAAVGVYAFRIVFIPLVVGGLLAYVIHPLVRRLSQLTHLPHGLATALVFLLLLATIVLAIAAMVPVAVEQVLYLRGELLKTADYLNNIGTQSVEVLGLQIEVQRILDEITASLTDLARTAASESLAVILNVAEVLLLTIFVVLVAFYLTLDSERILGWMRDLVPREYRADVEQLVRQIDAVWAAFLRGQLMLSAVATLIISIMASIIGLPQPLLMGLLAGLLEFLLNIGHTIWIIIALTLALLEGSTTLPVSNVVFALIVAGAHFVFVQVDLNFLVPRIIGGHIRLHPMVMILGFIVGASVAGVLGVMLAAPTIASLRVLGRYVYAQLFDLEPFPMVGPVSAPAHERRAVAERSSAGRGRRMSGKVGKAGTGEVGVQGDGEQH
jgi:predicted PurR-regulated permease PerM